MKPESAETKMINEQIGKLVQQARIGRSDFGDTVYYVCTEETFKRFTDLVVQECADRVSHLRGYSGYINDTDIVSTPDWNLAVETATNEIKQLLNTQS